MKQLQIRTFGDFSLQCGDVVLSDANNRTRKNWILLAWLICHRGRTVSQKKLIELLWGEEPSSSNPENALRITFHRTRALLDQLWPGAGHELIQRRDNGYFWNNEIPVVVDSEQFDELCRPASAEEEDRLDNCLKALELYRGEFLERFSSETWVIPISTHFHNVFLSTSMEAATLLSKEGCHREAADICRRAAQLEPYHEPLYQLLIQELGASADQKAAALVYEELSKRLFDDFGIRPSEETRAVYRAAVHTLQDKSLPMDAVLEHLQEPNAKSGAMRCDYDYFKVLCYAQSRSIERSGTVIHVALLSVSSGTEVPLTKRTQNRVMEQLGEQIRTNLRQGDVFSQCSVSQYIIMLPQANYENSCMVCRRILGAFQRRHPHVTARFNYMVQPLTPSICVP